jgi:hypothetical protein
MRLGIKVGKDPHAEALNHDQVAHYYGCPIGEARTPLLLLMIVKTTYC